MKLLFSERAWDDYLSWQDTDKQMLRRIHALIKETLRDPFAGIGKPEPLRHALSGFWSRRITGEHRMVYKIEGGNFLLAPLRNHY